MRISYQPVFTNNFKFNSYTLNFIMPLNEENATNSALLAQVLKRGCEKYGEMDRIAARLEELYGASITISTDKLGENLFFALQVMFMDDRYALAGESIRDGVLELASSLLFQPMKENGIFRSDFFAQEKQNHKDIILGLINDKRQYAIKRCKDIMFSDSAYRFSATGTLECLECLTADKLYSFYQNMLSGASVIVSYIGREENVEKLTEKYFSLPNCQCKIVGVSPVMQVGNPKFVSEALDVAQGKLTMGLRFERETEYYATRLFNVVYGGSPTSKLFNNVRERLSLCYYCSSTFDPFVHSVFISSGIEFENYKVASEEILHQLEDMKNGNISDEEFENGKLYLLDMLLGVRDSHSALLSVMLRDQILGITDSLETQIIKIQNVTKEDVIEVANALVLDTVYFLKGKECSDNEN